MIEAAVQDIGLEPPYMPAKTPQSRKEEKVQVGQAKTSGTPANADFIAIALKKLHSDVESEDVPKEFLDILADIDRKIGSSGDNN